MHDERLIQGFIQVYYRLIIVSHDMGLHNENEEEEEEEEEEEWSSTVTIRLISFGNMKFSNQFV